MRTFKTRLFQVLLALSLPLLALAFSSDSLGITPIEPVEAAPGVDPRFSGRAGSPVGDRPTEIRPPAQSAISSPLDDSGDQFPAGDSLAPVGCRTEGAWTVLLIGSDSRQGGFVYGLADAIRIVRLDFAAGRVTVLSLPRDLWVEIPGIADHYGITHGKLNQAFLYGGPGMGYYDGPGRGAGLLARTLEHNYGLAVDRTLAVDMGTFVEIVDALGGVDLYLDSELNGRSGGGQEDRYEAGWHHLDGEAALRFARLRAGSDDLSRIERQSALLAALLGALRARLLSPDVLTRLPDVVDSFWGAVATDITLRDLPALFCLASSMAPEDLRFIELPRDVLTTGREYSAQLGGRTSVLYVDPEALQALIRSFLAAD